MDCLAPGALSMLLSAQMNTKPLLNGKTNELVCRQLIEEFQD